jgi:hypothetical protein
VKNQPLEKEETVHWEVEALKKLSETQPDLVEQAMKRESETMKREYTVVYQPIEDGWVMATVPELPGEQASCWIYCPRARTALLYTQQTRVVILNGAERSEESLSWGSRKERFFAALSLACESKNRLTRSSGKVYEETFNREGKRYEAQHGSYPDHPRRQAHRV